MFSKIKNKAFTLAEILVTLGIIGVIASMTIPNLVQDIQDAQFKTAYKKAYTDINQATIRMLQGNSGSLKGVCTASNHDCLRNLYLSYLNYIKMCNNGFVLGNCWYSSSKLLNGQSAGWGDHSGIILNNGLYLRFTHSAKDCDSGTPKKCGYLTLDLNGFKSPNVVGKDSFLIYVLEDGLKPWGIIGDPFPPSQSCVEGSTATENNGYGCSAKYLYQ